MIRKRIWGGSSYCRTACLKSERVVKTTIVASFTIILQRSLVPYIIFREDFFLFCVFLCAFAFCIFVCVSLPSLLFDVSWIVTYFVKRSSECPLISFDKDQPNTILIATITANLKRSSVLGSRIVVKMSAPTTKSSDISKPPTKRNLITYSFEPSRLCGLYKDLMYPINATTADIPMIMAAAASIPIVT